MKRKPADPYDVVITTLILVVLIQGVLALIYGTTT